MDRRILLFGMLCLVLFTGAAYSYIGSEPDSGYSCPAGQFVDADDDGVCDNFVDEDEDGICDNMRGQNRDCGYPWMRK